MTTIRGSHSVCGEAALQASQLMSVSPQALWTSTSALPGLHPDPASRRELCGQTQWPKLTGLHGTALLSRAFPF